MDRLLEQAEQNQDTGQDRTAVQFLSSLLWTGLKLTLAWSVLLCLPVLLMMLDRQTSRNLCLAATPSCQA